MKNTLAALLIGKEVGLTAEQMRDALKKIVLTDMRMQVIEASNGSIFINDAYNAAPTSMKAAISFLESSSIKPVKWLVLGDMLELGENEDISIGYHTNQFFIAYNGKTVAYI